MSSDANALLDEIGAPKKPAAKSAMDLLDEVAPDSAHDLLDAVGAPATTERPTPPNNIDPDVLTQQIHARAAQEEKDAHPIREALRSPYSPFRAGHDLTQAVIDGLDTGGKALRRVVSDLNPFGAIKTEERPFHATVSDAAKVLGGLPPISAAGEILNKTVGDPLSEPVADTTSGRVGQGLRGGLRSAGMALSAGGVPIDEIMRISAAVPQIAPVKRAIDVTAGTGTADAASEIAPWVVTPFAHAAMKGSPEPVTPAGPPVDPMTFREARPRVAPVRAGIRPVEAPAVSAHALLDEVGAPKAETAAEPAKPPVLANPATNAPETQAGSMESKQAAPKEVMSDTAEPRNGVPPGRDTIVPPAAAEAPGATDVLTQGPNSRSSQAEHPQAAMLRTEAENYKTDDFFGKAAHDGFLRVAAGEPVEKVAADIRAGNTEPSGYAEFLDEPGRTMGDDAAEHFESNVRVKLGEKVQEPQGPAVPRGTPPEAPAPAAAPSEPQTQAPGAPRPQPSKPLHEMTATELRDHAAELKTYDKSAAVEVFGPERAAEYERAQRISNSTMRGASDPAVKAADKLVSDMERDLTPEQEKRLFGIGEEGADYESIRDLSRKVGWVEGAGSPAELADVLAKPLSDLGDATDPAKMSPSQLEAYAMLRRAQDVMVREGWDAKQVGDEALQRAFKRFSDPEDAAFMLQRFAKSKPNAVGALRAPSRFQGRPMSGEAGAIAIPGLPPPPDALPPGTPAERASIASVKERIRFGEEPKMPFVDRASDAAKKAEAQIVRKEAPLRRAEQFVTGDESDTGVTAQAKFAQGSSQGAAENLYKHGLLETGDVPAVEPALKAVVKAGRPLSDVSAYAAAKRAATGYEPNKLESGFDPADTAATVDLYEKNHPEVVAAADAIFKTNEALMDNLAEADRWDPKRRAEMKKRNPAYVEFRRDFGDAGEGSGETPSGKAAPLNGPAVKARTGGKQPIRDPLVRLQDSFRRMIAAADQARVKHSFLDMIRSNPTRAAALVEELTPAQLKAQIPDFDAIASSMNPTTAVEDFGKTFDAYDRAYKAGIIPKGDGHFLKVKDPSIAEALKGGDYEAANALTKLAGNITAIQRTGITQVSPTFPLRNLARDIGTYIAQAKEGNDLKMFANLGRGLYHAIRGELTKVGVSDTPYTEVGKRARLEGFFAADTTKSAPQGLARMEEGPLRYYLTRPLKAPGAAVGMTFDVWKSLNSGIEHAPRYAALISELDRMGWKPGDALTRDMLVKAGNSAQEITVNFRLGGDTGKALNRYAYNFFNPAVQGAEQLRQTFANQPKLAVRRALTYGVAPAVASYLYWQADPKRAEAWDRMTPWRRAQMNFPSTDENGNVHVISLPIAQEAGAIYSATTAAMDGIRSGDPKRFTDVMKEIVSRANPVDSPLHPSVVAPIQEVNEGKFSFSGRAINPKNLEGAENVLPQEVKQPYSSKLAYAVASWLHDSGAGGWMGMGKLTTADIDALIQGYGGTAARDVTRTRPTGETEGADMPIVGTFFPRMKESRFVDDYYQQRQTFGGQENLVGFLRKSHKPEDAAKAASLRLPQGIAGDIARIDHRLKELADRYQAAPEADRAGIAAAADSAAKHGLSLMKSAGVGSRKMPFAAKETR